MGEYPEYVGLDVSAQAITRCMQRFSSDRKKAFLLYSPTHFHDPLGVIRGDLALSLDVIYHLVEDDLFTLYMHHLFRSSTQYIIIYSSNADNMESSVPWIKHRRYSAWISKHCPEWQLLQHLPNPYTSSEVFADFRVFGRSLD